MVRYMTLNGIFSIFPLAEFIKLMVYSKIYQLQPCNFIKKETLAHVFSCDFGEISKKTFFTEQFPATASVSQKKISTNQ